MTGAAAAPPAISPFEIANIQATEIEAIQTILDHDFVPIQQKAWKGAASAQLHEFQVVLRPDEERLKPLLCAYVTFRLPKNYPLVPPTIIVKQNDGRHRGLSTDHLHKLSHELNQKAKSLLGAEMIWELITTGQEFISIHNAIPREVKDGAPSLSLEQEMQKRAKEEQERQHAHEQEERIRRKHAETLRSEQLAQLIQEEASKKAALLKQEKERKRENSYFANHGPTSPANPYPSSSSAAASTSTTAPAASASDASRIETFLDPIEHNGRVTSVLRVGPVLSKAGLAIRHLAEPAHDDPADSRVPSHTWILEHYLIASQHYAYSAGKRKLEEVEFEFDKLVKVREPGLLNVLASAVTRVAEPQGWKLSVVTERTDGVALRGLLQQCDSLPWKRVRHHLAALLKTLDSLHTRNLVHRSIDPDSVFVEAGASTSIRLAGACYSRRLKDMHKSNPLNDIVGPIQDDVHPDAWKPPEAIDQPLSYSRKRDIWDLGVCACQMLFGPDCIVEYDMPEHAIRSSKSLAPHVQAFLLLMLERASKKRPTAAALVSRLEELILYEDTELSQGSSTRMAPQASASNAATDLVTTSAIKATPRPGTARQKSDPNNKTLASPSPRLGNPLDSEAFGSLWPFRAPGGPGASHAASSSRYLSDFEEVEFLGKGAFGSVVKARNRLDGRFYAVKKIKLSSSPDEDERTLREISALSRLDHPHIVRYSTCWIEETHVPITGLTGSDTDGFSSAHTLETNTTTSKTHASGPSLSMSAFRNGFQRPAASKKPGNGRDDSFRAVPDFDEDDDVFASGASSSRLTGSYSDIRFADDDDDDSNPNPRNASASARAKAETSFKGGLLALRTPSDASSDDDSDSDQSSSDDDFGDDDDDDDFSRIPLSSRRASRAGRSMSRSVSVARPAGSVPVQRVLYIQMEFVENRTLREAIEKGLTEDEAWRILRQMVEALAHISSLGIIHRDLKPSNVLMYANGDVKIGDFGLATNALQIADGNAGTLTGTAELAESTDLTSDLGTFLYTAPELRAKGGTKYNFKVDIYSLGIIFFEMLASQRVYRTGMERILLIRELRNQGVGLPAVWPHAKLEKQTALIRKMLDHDPDRRPSPLEILKSDLLPPKMEDEYIEECLRLMANPTSAYNHQLMDALFSRTAADLVRDFTFDTGAETDRDTSLTSVVCDLIRSAARRHGAVEFAAPLIVPPNGLYTASEKIVQMLDRTGRVVHLPYDLTVPFARVFARSSNQRFKRYEIGNVFRENVVAGGQPRAVLAASFDIVSPEKSAAAEAEALALVEEVLDEIPGVASENWVIHINHEVILSMILDRIPAKHHTAVLGVVALLAGSKTMQAARTQLLQLGLPRSTIEELEAFNLNDDVAAVHRRLERLFPLDQRTRLAKAVSQISDVVATARFFGVQRRFLFSPLLAQSSSLYKGGVLFTVVRAGKRRDVVAAGGRYDALLKHFANPSTASAAPLHGVGVQLAVGKLTLGLSKYQEVQVPKLLSRTEEERSFGLYTPRRCDVYVASTPGLLETRMEICRELWAHGIAADLQYEHATYDTPESAAATCRAEGILLLVFAKARSPVLKVKVVLQRAEFEVARHELVGFVQDRIARQRSIDLQVAGSAGGAAGSGRFGAVGADVVGSRSATAASGAPGSLGGGHHFHHHHHHHAHGGFTRTYSGNEVMPSATIAVREREMLLPERPIERSKKGDKSQQNRPKPSSRQLVLDKASRQVSKFADQLQAGNVPILAVDFTGANFDRLAAALTACLGSHGGAGGAGEGEGEDEGAYMFRAFLETLSADEREYARLIKARAIAAAFPDSSAVGVVGCGRVFLYSLREDRTALIGCGR
ncbi:kinase-like protein [Moesziomyces antarcticus]|uniref:non-specific serine/threonine protein kinase n=2 Tax=Pseudozyma antarctica TaxID=84753 RepID=A0A081CM26_PSEA2|nr:kinase-like protein [Moesziomyces antarcticus]GAK67722.1 kinase-like protein [Moesziomyces antarcticus]SPO49046.1 related to GCN2 - ser/thr protein kinase [Moesziomyces antarcticus]